MSKHENEMAEAIRAMVAAAKRYAVAYEKHFDSIVGNDYVLGPEVAAVLNAAHGLLNGPTGVLDCGHMSSDILAIAKDHELLDKNGEIIRD